MTGLTGNSGNTGPTAATGNTGLTGNTGPTGAQGNSGNTGLTGQSGNTGPTGAGVAGNTGNTGLSGNTGQTGPTGSGVAGNTGMTGQTGAGVAGNTGMTGQSGNTGPTGAGVAGNTGLTGATGAGANGNTGATGMTGQTGVGATGPQGLTGTSGNTGPTGTGAAGATGAQGNTGLTGQSGNTGANGAASTVAGNTGNTGPTGSQGNTGLTGVGVTGPTGAIGQTGVGTTGPTGAAGQTGIQGTSGNTGPTGSAGSTGIQGTSGNTGTTGAQGTSGNTGPTGPQGNTGLTGNTGAGVAGNTGMTGQTGVGSTGPQGNTGLTGNTGSGVAGPTGQTGAQGTSGNTGPTGSSVTGATGSQGMTGLTGASGSTGATGATATAGSMGMTLTSGATGSVLYVGPTSTLAQDNANFFWDAANHRLGIGTTTPAAPLSVGSTSQFNVGSTGIVTVGTTVYGSAAAAGNLVLSSTSHGTKGRVYLGAIASYATFMDEATGNMGVFLPFSPTAQLHLGGGGSAPGSACLKMTSNALLSTPEAGAWEFKNDDLFFTISTGAARKLLTFVDSISLKTKRIPFGGTAGLMDDGNLQYNQTTKALDARRVAVGQFIESSSYGNQISSGERSSLGYVTVTASSGLMTGTPGNMVDGITSTVQTEYFNGGAVGPTTYMRFDFGSGSSQIVTEAKWYQQGSQTHGVWQWQGSNDATTWTNIGAAFTWGGAIISTQTTLSANTTGYRYYQLLGVSGTTSGAPYIYEIEFKSQNALPPAMFPNSYFSAFDVIPSYIETVIKNGSNGVTASADVMASNDFGTETTYFIDMGINSSGWSDETWTVCGANDGYLYTTGLLAIGTNTVGKDVVLFTGGTLAANARLRVDGTTGNVGIGTVSAAASSTLDVLGTARFGDHATNYTDFETDGTLHMTGAATVWNDVFMSGLATRAGSSAPTVTAFSGGVYGQRFDDGATAMEVHGSLEMQHDYKEGTALSVHVHWSPTTTNTGNIRWGLEYSIVNIGSAFPTTSTIYITQAGAGVVNQHQLVAFADISGTGRKIGDVIAFRLFRDANNAADTFTGNAFMHQIGIHYECDTIGSRLITTK